MGDVCLSLGVIASFMGSGATAASLDGTHRATKTPSHGQAAVMSDISHEKMRRGRSNRLTKCRSLKAT
jgi:hypothetical protein